MRHDWLIPDWPAHARVRAVFTTRAGGVSAAPYDTMNLGDHVGDLPANVGSNRVALAQAIDARPVFLRQVHGSDVAVLNDGSTDGQTADACLTSQRGLACTIMVADCLPVLLAAEDGSVIAAAHAGWRGLAGDAKQGGRDVLNSIDSALAGTAGLDRSKFLAWLGPCIGPAAFEVGAEVKAAFEAVLPEAGSCFSEHAPKASGQRKYLANLPALARLRLQALGISRIYGNDGSAPWCTVTNPSRFFSHRRDAGIEGNGFGTTGRMAACIWLD